MITYISGERQAKEKVHQTADKGGLALVRMQSLVLVLDAGERRLDHRNRAANAQRDQHQKEGAAPQLRNEADLGEALRVGDEGEARAAGDHVLNLLAILVGHVAQDGEDDAAGEQAGEGVQQADDDAIAEEREEEEEED